MVKVQEGRRIYFVEVRRDAAVSEVVRILGRMTKTAPGTLHLLYRGQLLDKKTRLCDQGYHGRDMMLLARGGGGEERGDQMTSNQPLDRLEIVQPIPLV